MGGVYSQDACDRFPDEASSVAFGQPVPIALEALAAFELLIAACGGEMKTSTSPRQIRC